MKDLVLQVLQDAGDYMEAQHVARTVWGLMDRHERAARQMRDGRDFIREVATVFHALHADGLVTLQNRINLISVQAKYLNPLERIAAV